MPNKTDMIPLDDAQDLLNAMREQRDSALNSLADCRAAFSKLQRTTSTEISVLKAEIKTLKANLNCETWEKAKSVENGAE